MRTPAYLLISALALSACSGGSSRGGITPSAPPQIGGTSPGTTVLQTPPKHYSVVDLGANVNPAAINVHNEVVGTDAGVPFRYQNGTLQKLSVPKSGSASATDVNDNGLVVGVGGDAVAWQPDGTLEDLGAPPNSYVTTAAVSNTGTILGLAALEGIAGCGGELFSFSAGAPPTSVGPDSLSVAMNGVGQGAVGIYNQQGYACTGTMQPVIYPSGASVPVAPQFTLDAQGGAAVTDINNAGHVLGYSPTTTSSGAGPLATFLVRNGATTEIDPPSGYYIAYGNGLNNLDWVVGSMIPQALHAYEHAFIWSNGQLTDLNTLVPVGCAWTLNTAQDINDNGYIIGTGTVSGTTHGFLLVPQP
jgi:hypothetical protein